jgi:hypothetical protein
VCPYRDARIGGGARPDGRAPGQRVGDLLVAEGATDRAIASRLNVTEATVKTYLTRIFTKLGVGDRTAAVTTALAQQLITLP